MILLDGPLLVAYAVTAAATVISPGPDTILILRHALAGGPRPGLAAVAGVQLGIVVHTAAAALGLSLLIASEPLLFRAIAVAGALYLGWLGYQGLRAGLLDPASLAGAVSVSRTRAARDALATNLLNPKVIVLFVALLPNFVRPELGQVWLQLAWLGLILIAINSAWQVMLALAADPIRRWLSRARVQRLVSWTTGAVLLAFAVGFLVEHVFAALA